MTRKEFLILNRQKYKKLKPYVLQSMKEKYIEQDIFKIGYLDIETENLEANFGVMWSWAISVRNVENNKNELRKAVINESDFRRAKKKDDWDTLDKRITEQLIENISDLDYLVGHWFVGKHRHDIPYVRTRCIANNIGGFPKHRMIRYGDTQKWGSQLYRLHSFGLAALADAFGVIQEKTRIRTKDWKNAKLGSKKSLKYILNHNIIDVEITHQVHKKIEEQVSISNSYA